MRILRVRPLSVCSWCPAHAQHTQHMPPSLTHINVSVRQKEQRRRAASLAAHSLPSSVPPPRRRTTPSPLMQPPPPDRRPHLRPFVGWVWWWGASHAAAVKDLGFVLDERLARRGDLQMLQPLLHLLCGPSGWPTPPPAPDADASRPRRRGRRGAAASSAAVGAGRPSPARRARAPAAAGPPPMRTPTASPTPPPLPGAPPPPPSYLPTRPAKSGSAAAEGGGRRRRAAPAVTLLPSAQVTPGGARCCITRRCTRTFFRRCFSTSLSRVARLHVPRRREHPMIASGVICAPRARGRDRLLESWCADGVQKRTSGACRLDATRRIGRPSLVPGVGGGRTAAGLPMPPPRPPPPMPTALPSRPPRPCRHRRRSRRQRRSAAARRMRAPPRCPAHPSNGARRRHGACRRTRPTAVASGAAHAAAQRCQT